MQLFDTSLALALLLENNLELKLEFRFTLVLKPSLNLNIGIDMLKNVIAMMTAEKIASSPKGHRLILIKIEDIDSTKRFVN